MACWGDLRGPALTCAGCRDQAAPAQRARRYSLGILARNHRPGGASLLDPSEHVDLALRQGPSLGHAPYGPRTPTGPANPRDERRPTLRTRPNAPGLRLGARAIFVRPGRLAQR